MASAQMKGSGPARRPVWLAGLLLLVLPFVLFWRVWWPDAGQRRVFAYGDFVEQHYPMRVFVAGELREGRLPFWDPYTFGGEPAVAESLFSTYYPLGLWQVIFQRPFPFMALEVEAIFHLGLAGLFTCLFVRRLTGRLGAGLLAGVAFGLGGFLTCYPMLQLIILEAAVWLPAALWLIERGLARRSLRDMALAGAALACSILAGHFQTFLYVAYLVGAYLVFRLIQARPGWRFAAGSLAVIGSAALGLSAGQWLPSLEMAQLSPRGELGYAELSKGFAPAELWGLLRPNRGEWSPLYVGVIPLALAFVAVVVGAFGKRAVARRAQVAFWLAVVVVAALLSLGANAFLYPLAYRLAPGFSLFRQQERAALLVTFGLAVLAGLGLAGLSRWRRWPRPAWLPLLGFAFVDLFLANQGVILQAAPAGGYFPATPATRYLDAVRESTWRVSTEGLLPGDGNAGLVYRFRDVVGSGPLYLADFERFLERVPELRWWQMLNVDYLVTRRQIDHGALKLIQEEAGLRLYQAFLGGQAAWIVHEWTPASSAADAIEQTAQQSLDPLKVAVLEGAPAPLPAPAAGVEFAHLVGFKHQRVTLDVSLSAPGVVVLSEVFYPGWQVRVNGRPTTPLRAYGLLRAVALPAGEWRIEWRFVPVSALVGLGISLIYACGGVLLGTVWFARRAYSGSSPPMSGSA